MVTLCPRSALSQGRPKRSIRASGVVLGAVGVWFTLFSSGCSSKPKPSSQSSHRPDVSLSATPSYLWGAVTPVVSVKELMHDFIDPTADNIFDAVSTIVTKHGFKERLPQSDEDWNKIQFGAVGLAEGAALLRIRRPFEPSGSEQSARRSDAELTPSEMLAKVTRDPVEWNARIEALRNVGLEVIDIVKRRDTQELWDAGQNLDTACENCHRSYWYPGEGAAFYDRLDKRLERLHDKGFGLNPNHGRQ